MEWLTEARGQLLFLDTAPFIYFIEEHPRYLQVVRPMFESLDRGEIRVVTSVLTLMEATVLPLRQGNTALARTYLDVIGSAAGLEMRSIGPQEAMVAASLRAANPSLRAPDAIQLSVARTANASWFVTNDRRLRAIEGLRIVFLDDWATQETG